MVHSTSWKTWNDLEKGLSTDIISHYIFETFSRAYRVLDQNRELLDNLVSKLMIKCRIQEIDTIEDINYYLNINFFILLITNKKYNYSK